LVLRWF